MITELCKVCNNYFAKSKHFGKFTIENGTIAPLDFLQEGQYFRIVGSTFNDGVYQYPSIELTDEIFDGAIWAMSVPPAFIALATDIKTWSESNKGVSASPFTSENYPNGYSYTVATEASGAPLTWQTIFSKQIAQWRKL